MTEIVYSMERIPNLSKSQKFYNPIHFSGVDEKATKVIINGDYPKIRRAYEAVKIPVEDYQYPQPKKTAEATRDVTTQVPAAQKGSS